ncbi:hypothetical protein PAHAL_3G292100 [Panicum hallii]|uniref:Uncharacterized protein n=1 Tax=Panicum hallii TaxID=206008 RepID=A0A2T8KJS5_9POAL|nr:hypothetical protein PAHAL_3G292100 [Panicum hallii]
MSPSNVARHTCCLSHCAQEEELASWSLWSSFSKRHVFCTARSLMPSPPWSRRWRTFSQAIKQLEPFASP